MIDVTKNCLATGGQLQFIHTSLAPLHLSLARLFECKFSAEIAATKPISFRAHYGKLIRHFAQLRSDGYIFYDANADNSLYEVLYMIKAKRFDETEDLQK